MKFFYLFILFQIHLCFFQDFLNKINLLDKDKIITEIKNLYELFKNMKPSKEKDDFARNLGELIIKVSHRYTSDKDILNTLEEILAGLRTSDYISASTHSVSFFISDETFKTFTGNVKKTTTKLVEYCNEKTCEIPKNILMESKDTLTTTASISSKWVYVSNGDAFVGHGLAAYLKFKESYEKCKAKGKEDYFLSAVQSLANVGTNIAFGAAGSYLGTFIIPIPFAGSLIGGFFGSLVGSKINQQYEFDC